MLLGFQEHDIALLVAAKLLVPLGRPAPDAPNDFAVTDIAVRSIELRLALEGDKSIGQALAAKKSAKAAKGELLCVT